MRKSESDPSQEIRGVASLGELIPVGSGSDLHAQKIAQLAKISHLKLLLKVMLDEGHMRRIITSNDHIIHIEQQKSPATKGGVHKQGRIMWTRLKTGSSNG